jgi:glycosyltransferase involved in cell wall biosynthesis
VIPSHGEGWGRPHMESMSCGTPVVYTNWSGPTAFITSETGFPIRIENDLIPAGSWGKQGHHWAQPSVDHLSTVLREIYLNPSIAHEKGMKAREHILLHYSLSIIGNKLVEEFRRIDEILQQRENERRKEEL